MGEDQNKSDADRFEESLRQILDGAPSGGHAATPKPPVRPEDRTHEATADKAESNAIFWFKLLRPLALAALLALLAMFVMRITAARQASKTTGAGIEAEP